MTDSRSRLRRIAIEKGEPAPRFDRITKPTLDGWPLDDLRYSLRRQTAPGVSTWGTGICGHHARGCGWCAKCLQAEIDRREAATAPQEDGRG